jgi:NDP-sugar pyrophosphorylase family protein
MINIVIPMAGRGSRFEASGYGLPKPLVEIHRRPMIQVVVDNLRPRDEHRFVFICQESHFVQYSLNEVLGKAAPGCEIVTTDGITAGAACSILLAAEHFAGDEEMMIANSDQYVDFESDLFLKHARDDDLDGDILTFPATHPKWSYARIDESRLVVEVAEKRPISEDATVGLYYFRRGQDFIEGASQMIEKDIRTNNEFYVCPVYNELILMGRKIGAYPIDASVMHGLGTPEDFEQFLTTETCARLA